MKLADLQRLHTAVSNAYDRPQPVKWRAHPDVIRIAEARGMTVQELFDALEQADNEARSRGE